MWEKAASRLITPRGGKCIRPLRALGRHIRPRWAQCTNALVRHNTLEHVPHQKCPFYMGPWTHMSRHPKTS